MDQRIFSILKMIINCRELEDEDVIRCLEVRTREDMITVELCDVALDIELDYNGGIEVLVICDRVPPEAVVRRAELIRRCIKAG